MKSLTAKLFVINIVIMIAFAGLFLCQTYSRTHDAITRFVTQQAALALQFDLSIRRYAAEVIRPSMYERIKDDEFYPETMSTSYIARSIFEDVRKQFPDYIIKFSADNPRNPLNQAGPEELGIIRAFGEQPTLDQWEGEITIGGKKYLAKFKARRTEQSCIRCHGDPGSAPASLIQRYGDKNGFHKKLGDIIGLDTIAVPMTKVMEQQRSAFLNASYFVSLGIVMFFSLTFFINRQIIVNRLAKISKHFQAISREKDYRQIRPLAIKGNDEISDLAASFNIMAGRLKESITQLNAQVDRRTQELQREIAEHKKAEEQLRQSEEKFRLAFQTSPNVITLTSIADGTYIDINEAFTKLLGYERDEVIGKSALALNVWKDVRDRERLVEGLRRHGIVNTLDAQYQGKDGQLIDGIMSARILTIDNEKFLLATTQDITPIKQAERERLNLEIKLQQAHKMEAIGTLAGGIAHDFNNILSGIFGYTQLAQSASHSPEKVERYTERIMTGAQRAAELIQQILTFSRQTEYLKNPLDLRHEVTESLKLLRASIPATIDFNIRLRSEALVFGDSTKIHQVVMNLCTNSYHSMISTGGTLTVSLDDVKMTGPGTFADQADGPGDYVRLEVSDTGCGMDEETLKKATEPYFTTKGPGHGTGLGLALVRAIVDEHDGFLDIRSAVKKGSSVSICLPTISRQSAQKPFQTSPAAPQEEEIRGRESIMVVDDEDSIRDSLTYFLEDYGYRVFPFQNGQEALEAFESDPGRYDLIVTDMTMPKLSGQGLAQAVLSVKPALPVLLCTGYSEHITKENVSALGIRQFIQKPFDNHALIREIRKILDD